MAESSPKRLKSDPLLAWIADGSGPVLSLDDAIQALDLFTQLNFTGPPTVESIPAGPTDIKLWDALNEGSQKTTLLVEYPQLLTAAIATFKALKEPIWLARALVLQQSLFKEPVDELREQIISCYTRENIENHKSKYNVSGASLLAEAARAHLVYDEDVPGEELLTEARKLSGLVYEITGIEGRVTKFQTKPTVQLVCIAKSKNSSGSKAVSEGPANVQLESQLMYEVPQLENLQIDDRVPTELRGINPVAQPPLEDLDCALLLLQAEHWIQRNPSFKDPLVAQQVLAYVSRVIANTTKPNWSLYTRALWMRSELEAEAVQTVQRSSIQMESVVNELASTSGAPVEQRIEFIHLLMPKPKWQLDKVLVDRLMSLGDAEGAIPVYIRLRRLADAALCYAVLGQVDKAIEVLDDHLKAHPEDARAWAIKGDITRDPQYWEKAWEVGKHPGAQRSLAKYYYSPPPGSSQERDAAKARHALEQSLLMDSYSYDAYFMLGCIEMELENWEAAARAFQQCVAIEDDDIKSWTNLAGALIQLDKFRPALHALNEAMRVNRNSEPNWKVWTNYVTVATRLGAWDDVITALKQLVKPESVAAPPNLASTLAEAVFTFTSAEEYDDENQQHVDFANIVGSQLTSRISADNKSLWKLVARVESWRGRPWAALAASEKAFNHPVVDSESSLVSATKAFGDLLKAYRTWGDCDGRIEGSKACPNWQMKARTTGRALLAKAQQFKASEAYEQLENMVAEI